MRRAMEVAHWNGFRQRLAEAGGEAGSAASAWPAISRPAGGPAEERHVQLETDGTVTVLIGTQSTGQGHQTAYAQLVAEHLDLPLERVRVLQGDTDLIATGGGTGGSRSIPVGGASVRGASSKLADNLKELAADALEAGVGDLEIADGHVRIAGTDRPSPSPISPSLPRATPSC